MKRTQAGFTLIELMIVIAILGILAAIAIPAYQDYSIRAKTSEGIYAVAPAKLAVSEYFQSEGTWPDTRTRAGVSEVDSNYVDNITVVDGIIRLGMDTSVATGTGSAGMNPACSSLYIQMTPANSTGAVDWTCIGVADVAGTALAATSTCLRIIPSSCR